MRLDMIQQNNEWSNLGMSSMLKILSGDFDEADPLEV